MATPFQRCGHASALHCDVNVRGLSWTSLTGSSCLLRSFPAHEKTICLCLLICFSSWCSDFDLHPTIQVQLATTNAEDVKLCFLMNGEWSSFFPWQKHSAWPHECLTEEDLMKAVIAPRSLCKCQVNILCNHVFLLHLFQDKCPIWCFGADFCVRLRWLKSAWLKVI